MNIITLEEDPHFPGHWRVLMGGHQHRMLDVRVIGDHWLVYCGDNNCIHRAATCEQCLTFLAEYIEAQTGERTSFTLPAGKRP